MKHHRHAPTEHARRDRKYARTNWRNELAGYISSYRNPAIMKDVQAIAAQVSAHNAARAVAICCGILNQETLYTCKHWEALEQAGYAVRAFYRSPQRKALLRVCIRHMRAIAAKYDWE